MKSLERSLTTLVDHTHSTSALEGGKSRSDGFVPLPGDRQPGGGLMHALHLDSGRGKFSQMAAKMLADPGSNPLSALSRNKEAEGGEKKGGILGEMSHIAGEAGKVMGEVSKVGTVVGEVLTATGIGAEIGVPMLAASRGLDVASGMAEGGAALAQSGEQALNGDFSGAAKTFTEGGLNAVMSGIIPGKA